MARADSKDQEGTKPMKRLTFAIVTAGAMMIAACGTNEDAVNEVDANAAEVDQLNALATDAANDAANALEAETLANQANQLADESNASADTDTTPAADDEAMNVAGM
jgi:hypothetical protein